MKTALRRRTRTDQSDIRSWPPTGSLYRDMDYGKGGGKNHGAVPDRVTSAAREPNTRLRPGADADERPSGA
ncbi:hypothetical protein GCM10020220_023160 [Nonomuraea rubra]